MNISEIKLCLSVLFSVSSFISLSRAQVLVAAQYDLSEVSIYRNGSLAEACRILVA